ncbi:MAG: hypothetical protein V7K50_21040 [Nostoc sp.]|uniref:hypothetical protein n=1 Tax=Nostoc sp. TaxID=1180 RepID=UPI002FFC54C0
MSVPKYSSGHLRHTTELLPQLEYKDYYSSHRLLLLHDVYDGLRLRTSSKAVVGTFEDFRQKALPVVTRSEKIRIYVFVSYLVSCPLPIV